MRWKCSLFGIFLGIFRVVPVFATIAMLVHQILYFHGNDRLRRTVAIEVEEEFKILTDETGKMWRVERQNMIEYGNFTVKNLNIKVATDQEGTTAKTSRSFVPNISDATTPAVVSLETRFVIWINQISINLVLPKITHFHNG